VVAQGPMHGHSYFEVRKVGPLLRYQSKQPQHVVEIEGNEYYCLHAFRAQHRRFADLSAEELETILRNHPDAYDRAGRPRYDFRLVGGVQHLRCPSREERQCRDYQPGRRWVASCASMASASASAMPGSGAGEPVRAELPGGARCSGDVGTSAEEVAGFSLKSSKSELACPEGDPSPALELSRPAGGANVPLQGRRLTIDFQGAAPPPPMPDIGQPPPMSLSLASGGQLPQLGMPSAERAAPCPLNDLD
jgi:hypothetical protein